MTLAGAERAEAHAHASPRRATLEQLAAVVASWLGFVLLILALGRLGFPLGLDIVPIGEDINWIMLLQPGSATRTAQEFWELDSRNPLSPWWYVAVRPVLTGSDYGLYWVRLGTSLLLGLSCYAFLRSLTAARHRAICTAAAMLVAIWHLNTRLDSIVWNFLGALALSLLAIASYSHWLEARGPRSAWYGASIVLWFAAFTTYLFQSGAIVAMFFLSLLHGPSRGGMPGLAGRVARAMADTAPHALLWLLFILIWRTTQEPRYGAVFTPDYGGLLGNLLLSVGEGLVPAEILRVAGPLSDPLGLLGGLLVVLGAGACFAALVAATSGGPADARIDAGGERQAVVLSTARIAGALAAVALPTVLIESVSAIWRPGTRWPMLYPVWLPVLLTVVAWVGTTFAVRRPALRVIAFSGVIGFFAGFAFLYSLQVNARQHAISDASKAFAREVRDFASACRERDCGVRAMLVLVDGGVPLALTEFGSRALSSVLLPGGELEFRLLHPAEQVERRLVVTEDGLLNLLGPDRMTPSSEFVIARFDGHSLAVLAAPTEADVRDYAVEWRRPSQITGEAADPVAIECRGAWSAGASAGAEGLRAAERNAGGPFRWMVANPARVPLGPACSGPAMLEIVVADALDPAQLGSLTARLGRTAVPLELAREGSDSVARGAVPPGALAHSHAIRAELRIDGLRTVPGTSVQLGLALREVRLTPRP